VRLLILPTIFIIAPVFIVPPAKGKYEPKSAAVPPEAAIVFSLPFIVTE
jgi:hypothetical protein